MTINPNAIAVHIAATTLPRRRRRVAPETWYAWALIAVALLIWAAR